MGATQQCMGEYTPRERQGSVAEAICASMYEPTVDSSHLLPTSYDHSLPLCLLQASCSVAPSQLPIAVQNLDLGPAAIQ